MTVGESAGLWVFLCFAANLLLTLHNKWVLSSLRFNFPWTLTALHISISGVGAYLLLVYCYGITPTPIKKDARLRLLMFSVLYAINIAISNVSLAHVSLAFHQLLRSATPAFTIITELALFRKTRTLSIYLSLLPVVLGIGLATVDQFSDITFTWVGLFLTVIGVLLSCLKGIVTNMIMVGPLKLHPLEVIWRMALPSVIQCLLFGLAFGEWGRIPDFFTRSDEQFAFDKAGKLFVNGMLAMWLNWVSFTANQKTSALTMTVAGNVKQALSIILAVYVFNTQVTPANMAGVIIALAGGAWYRYEEALHYNTHKCSYESYSEAARSKHDYVECKEVPPI